MTSGFDNMSGYYGTDAQQRQLFSTISTFLFAADLPDGTCEEDLYGFFQGYKMQTSKVVQGINRTYAFVSFETKQDAERARKELNGVTIQAKYATGINKISKPVRLCRYESRSLLRNIDPKCNLLVKNLSNNVSAHLLFKTFLKFGDIRSSKLMVDIIGESKGFGFISYYKVDDAERAIKTLNNTELGGKVIKINFLEKGRPHQSKRNNIYVKEIPKKNFGDKELTDLFSKFGKINSAIVLKDEKGESKGFGFVCFEKPEEAEKALKEMNGKKIFDDVENKLYVSFALKKAERQEELIKMKEKLFKESQKMTIYAKIQEEDNIKTEEEFKNKIFQYLNRFMGTEYKPKSIKIRFEQKNAFITMNTVDDAKNFIKKFQEATGEKNDIYFNTYKSKLDRAIAQQKFKSYNAFSETGSMVPSSNSSAKGGPKMYNNFNNFNDFGNNNNQQMKIIQRPQQERQYKSFNDFNDFGNQNQMQQQMRMQQPRKQFNNFNNFEDVNKNNKIDNIFNCVYSEKIKTLEKGPIKDSNDAGDFIYEIAEAMFPPEGGKITGMILELGLNKLNNIIFNQPENLKEQIIKGHNLIVSDSQKQK